MAFVFHSGDIVLSYDWLIPRVVTPWLQELKKAEMPIGLVTGCRLATFHGRGLWDGAVTYEAMGFNVKWPRNHEPVRRHLFHEIIFRDLSRAEDIVPLARDSRIDWCASMLESRLRPSEELSRIIEMEL